MPDMDPKIVAEMLAKARAELTRVASDALQTPATVTVLDTDWAWSDLRMRHRLHGRVYSRLTTATLAIDPAGNETGWSVQSRRDRCAAIDIPPDHAERIARTHRDITPRMKLDSVKTIEIADGKKMAVCRFSPAADGRAREVFVSPMMREVIGIAPVIEGATKPVPAGDDMAQHALILARRRVATELAVRAGPLAAQDADKLVHVQVDRGSVDPAGWRVYDLTLWSFFSVCDATNDIGQEEPGGWHMEALGETAPERRIDAETAIQAAKPHLLAKENTAGPTVQFSESRGRHRASVLWWHVEQGLVVEGDQTMVYVNAWDAKVFSISRRWRKIDPELFKQAGGHPGISGEEALRIAQKSRLDHHVDPRAKPALIDRAIIEVSPDPELPIPPRDVIAWRVGFRREDAPGFTELAIDERTGQVVRATGW